MSGAALCAGETATDGSARATPPFGAHTPPVWFRAVRRLALSQRPVQPLRRLLASALKGLRQPLDLEHLGLKLRLYPHDNIQDRWIIKVGRHPEEDETDMFARWTGREVSFVDVGANVGYFSLRAWQVFGAGSKILALEPHPRTFRKLLDNFRLNGATEVQAVQTAVGASTGAARLAEIPGNEGENSLRAEQSAGGGIEVPVAPLLDVVQAADFAGIDILKIDVEGFEDDVLLPFFDAAEKSMWPAVISMEVSQEHLWRTDVVTHLMSLGYVVSSRRGPNLVLEYRDQSESARIGDAAE